MGKILRNITDILHMIKFSHSVFALPFAIMAAFLAADGGKGGFCGWGKLFLIVWCMVCARSVAMTFNRIVDDRIDGRNPRTAGRAIPAGKISVKKAGMFLFLCSFFFAVGTYLFWKPLNLHLPDAVGGGGWFGYGNYWPMILGFPVLLFICLYSYSKRFTWASHFWLGASLMLAPLSAWIAISPPDGPLIAGPVLILSGAVFLWSSGFDIIYSCQDIAIDRQEGLYSLPANLGLSTALWISRVSHSLAITLLLWLGWQGNLGRIYLAAVVVAGGLLIIEHLLVRTGKMTYVATAFGTINGVISLILAAAVIFDVMY